MPTLPCQRCGISLPLNEPHCRNCGFQNGPVQGNNTNGYAPPSNPPWGVGTPPISYGQAPHGGQQWSQPTTPPFQQGHPRQASASQQPGPTGYYTPPPQSMGNSAFYGTPGQPSNAGNYYTPPHPQQVFYTNLSRPLVTGGLQGSPLNSPQTSGLHQFPPERRKLRVGRVLGLVILLVAIIGGSVFGIRALTKKNITVQPTVMTVAATPTPKLPPTFADSFTDNHNNWNLQSSPGQFSVAVGGGALTLEDDNHSMLWAALPGGKLFSDFKLAVDAVLSKGDQNNGYGLFIRTAFDQNGNVATYYRFSLYGDGTYAIFKGAVDANGNSQSTALADYTSNPAIQKAGEVNHISIIANGSTMTFVVNGQTLKTVNDSSYTNGSIALFVINLKDAQSGGQAKFSNLAIYPPQA
ncbi:MAG: DUF1080 domain-containing protein [Chloroflexi bacterium]|nr:DUF1080 domain-containing protein [Chloroflexota bacterium]